MSRGMRLYEKIFTSAFAALLLMVITPQVTQAAVYAVLDDGAQTSAPTPRARTEPANGNGTHDDPYVVPGTGSAIKVDAVLDEEAWDSALVLTLNYEVSPGENIPPPVETEVLLTYDESHLYAAFRCYDPDPAAISANLSDRDNIGGGDDWVGLILDTFNDQRRSFDLLVNPLGVQEDFVEAESGGQSWDGIWDSAGRITDWGYAVEVSVPFNQLRFQRTDTPQVWGFDAVRSYPRSLRHHIGAFPRDRNNNCYLCQAVKIEGFQSVSPGKNIEMTPTLIGTRTDARSDFPSGDLERERQDVEVGLTGRWGVTPNMTFLGTINPDFSHVEADAFQLDINQPFALWYPERRPFFLEGADFFDTLKSIVYTRTFRDPIWGLKLSGKERRNTVGAYVVQDDLTNIIFPGSQYSDATSLPMKSTGTVLRYKRDIASSSAAGVMLTDREGKDYFNRLLGLDCDLRVTPTDQIQLQLLGSSTSYPDNIVEEYDQPAGDFTGNFIAFEYDHDARNVYWWLDYDQVDRNFRADLGFIPRVGFRNAEGGLFFKWFPAETSWWANFRVGGEGAYYEDDAGNLLDKGGTLWTSFSGAVRSEVYAEANQYREAYNGQEFDLTSFHIQGGLRPTADSRLYLWTHFGDRIDYANTRPGDRAHINPYANYHVNKHLFLELDHTYETLDVEGGRLYTANISQFGGVYQFNVRTFVRVIVQYVHYDRDPELYEDEVDPEYSRFFTQLLFSYKVNPRTVVYLGYTDDHYGDQDIALTQANRTFFAKLSYAWVR